MRIPARPLLVALGAAALALPTAAGAAPGKGGQAGGEKRATAHAKAKSKRVKKVQNVTYVVRGVYDAADGTLDVRRGNSHAKRGGLVGDVIALDLSRAKITVADTNGDGSHTAADVVDGDRVLVQLRLPRREPGTGPFLARKLVDQTNPLVEEEAVTETEVVPAA